MKILAQGISCMQTHIGPWTGQDLILGLAAMAKVSEKKPLKPPGRLADDLSSDMGFLTRAQHWRALSEAVYAGDSATFSLMSHLPESSIISAEWNPNQETLRPAYALCIDPEYAALVLCIRGTSQIVDVLVSSGASPESFMGGHGHAGFVHATNSLLEEIEPQIKNTLNEESRAGRNLELVIVGHSLGAAVAIMSGLKLRDQFKDLKCWGFSPPAALSLDLAKKCSSFATCIMGCHDIVSRFSIPSVEDLRKRVCGFDWEEAKRLLKDDQEWQRLSKVVDMMDTYRRAQDGMEENLQPLKDKLCKVIPGSKNENEGENSNGKTCDETPKDGPPTFHPPGRLIVVASDPPGCGVTASSRSNVPHQRDYGTCPTHEEAKRVKWSMTEAQQEDFTQIIVSPWCVSDHLLGFISEAINYFQLQCLKHTGRDA